MSLARICACMMWFIVWQLNGANSQLFVEVRQYTSSAKTEHKLLLRYTDPSAPRFLDFSSRQVNIPPRRANAFEARGRPDGITGFLYYPTPHNACSEVDTPPASNNTDVVWLAIVSGYPSCTPENIMFLNTAGYRVMITYSYGDTNRVPPSGTDFPVAIVSEEFANYLIQNATVTSADGLIVVYIANEADGLVIYYIAAIVVPIVCMLWYLVCCLVCLKRRFCASNKRIFHGVRNSNATRQERLSQHRSQELYERPEQHPEEQLQPREVMRRQIQQSPGNVQSQEQQHRHQLSSQQQQHRRHVRPPNTVPTNVSERAGQSPHRQQPVAPQQRRQEAEGRQRNDNQQRGIPRLLPSGNGSQRQPQEAQQQIDVDEHQETLHQQLEPTIYQNVRTSVRGRRAYNMQTDAFRSCPICLDDFTNGETVRVLPCDQDHIFHLHCVNQWLRQHQECPVCRENVIDREGTAQPEGGGIPRLLPREPTQRSTSNNGQVESTAEPFYGNIRSSFSGRQFNIQTEPCKTCSICLVDFSDGETVRVLPCDPDHIFHAACIQPWITANRFCPVCRENVTGREQTQQNTREQERQAELYGNIRISFRGRQFNIQTEPCKTCPICLVDFDDGEAVRALPCDPDHIFHAACLQQWITRHRWCPVCRIPFE